MAWPAAGSSTGSHPMMPGIQIGPPAGALHTQLGVPPGAKLSILALAKAAPGVMAKAAATPQAMKRRRAFFAKEGDMKRAGKPGMGV